LEDVLAIPLLNGFKTDAGRIAGAAAENLDRPRGDRPGAPTEITFRAGT